MISYCLISTLFTPRVRILRRGRAYVFGRDKSIDFPIPSDVVSRKHAELAWAVEGGFQVKDLGSKNGTRVNNVPVLAPHALRDGETVTIGPFSFQYREYRGDIATLMNEPSGDDLETTAAIDGDVMAHIARVRAGLAPALPPAGFGGNFQGIELLEICRLVGAGEKDGILTIQGDALSGQLGFLNGEIRRALAAGLQGETAVMALLSLASGRFEFTQGAMNLERNCRIRPDSVAMEVARRQDEQGKSPAVAPAAPPLPPVAHTTLQRRAPASAAAPAAGPLPGEASGAGSATSVGPPEGEKDPTGSQPVMTTDVIMSEPTERIPKLPPGAGQGADIQTADIDKEELDRRRERKTQ